MEKEITVEENQIYTDNQGVLDRIEPFNYLRGKHNRDKCMGLAKNKEGKIFEIYPMECGLGNNCYCWATAEEINQ